MRALLLLLPLVAWQGAAAPKTESRELDPGTRPYLEVPLFRRMRCVTVSMYTVRNGGKTERTRVYRFTYRADIKAETAKWMKVLGAKDGWKREHDDRDIVFFSRQVKHPKIKGQVLLLASRRFVFDPKAHARTRVVNDNHYVTVSFNETLK